MDDVLIGHYFASTFPGESTDFDLTKVENIIENKSTSHDVVAVLGKPAGEVIYPILVDPEVRALWYRFYGPRGGKSASFEIDKDGIERHFSVRVEPKKK